MDIIENKTIEEIILEKLEESRSYDEFRAITGLDNATASSYWMNKKIINKEIIL